jgi:multidrug resistance efflux pump
MLELLLCSMVTILPDFLYRRFAQDKRLGRDITITSVWYELRWGITGCVLLTLALITVVFFYHPASNSGVSYFRTIPILPETSGRVTEVYVGLSQPVKAGDPIFRLDSSAQQAAVATARARVAEAEADLTIAMTDRAAALARIDDALSALKQAQDELDTKLEIQRRNAGTVTQREIDRLQNTVDGRQAGVDLARANLETLDTQISTRLPAQRDSAQAALAQAEVDLAKTTVYAGIDGRVEQFLLRPGDIVNPFMRPAGLLIPIDGGRTAIQAGFDQIEAPVLNPGMIGEAACVAKPFEVISLVVTDVQGVIASGQLRAADQLIDLEANARAPGSLTVFLEPLYPEEFTGLPPGSSCIVNVYTSNHDRLQSEDLGTGEAVWLHLVDTVGLVHALLLRLQALLMPVRTLVLSGGH